MSRLAALFLAVFAQLRSVLPFAGGEIRGPRSGSKRLSATANIPIDSEYADLRGHVTGKDGQFSCADGQFGFGAIPSDSMETAARRALAGLRAAETMAVGEWNVEEWMVRRRASRGKASSAFGRTAVEGYLIGSAGWRRVFTMIVWRQ